MSGLEILVIGVGNPLRGDDGAGPTVASLFAHSSIAGLRTLAVHQLTPELVDVVAGARSVIFVDAARSNGDQNLGVRRLGPGAEVPTHSHYLSADKLLAVATMLNGAAPEAWLLGIPAVDFDSCDNLSDVARAGVESARCWIEAFAHNRSLHV